METIKHIPNMLSGYRLLTFPWLMYFIFTDQPRLFAYFICVNFITDILDGFISRRFNVATPFGARLDSLADYGSYIAAITAIIYFHLDAIAPYAAWFIVFLVFYLGSQIFGLVKYRKFPSFHLYSFKASGYVQGLFLMTLFLYQFVPSLFIAAMVLGILANSEEILAIIKHDSIQSDIGTVFKSTNYGD